LEKESDWKGEGKLSCDAMELYLAMDEEYVCLTFFTINKILTNRILA